MNGPSRWQAGKPLFWRYYRSNRKLQLDFYVVCLWYTTRISLTLQILFFYCLSDRKNDRQWLLNTKWTDLSKSYGVNDKARRSIFRSFQNEWMRGGKVKPVFQPKVVIFSFPRRSRTFPCAKKVLSKRWNDFSEHNRQGNSTVEWHFHHRQFFD